MRWIPPLSIPAPTKPIGRSQEFSLSLSFSANGTDTLLMGACPFFLGGEGAGGGLWNWLPPLRRAPPKNIGRGTNFPFGAKAKQWCERFIMAVSMQANSKAAFRSSRLAASCGGLFFERWIFSGHPTRAFPLWKALNNSIFHSPVCPTRQTFWAGRTGIARGPQTSCGSPRKGRKKKEVGLTLT